MGNRTGADDKSGGRRSSRRDGFVPAEGELLAGRYELRHHIANGGMAEVWGAIDLQPAPSASDDRVAIKILHAKLARDRESVSRFEQEARTMMSLRHPNIVEVLDAGRDGDCHYLAMEYVGGGSAAEWLAQSGPLDPEVAAAMLAQLGKALHWAHREGVIHRDVKPANILVARRPPGELLVKLTDFGVARQRGNPRMTQYGQIPGTVPYTAPEVALGGEPTEASDIYSAGVTMYELLANELPFRASTYEELVEAQQREPTSLRTHNRGVSRRLSDVTLTAMAATPKLRFDGDAGRMAEAMQLAGEGKDVGDLLPTRMLTGITVLKPGARIPPGSPNGADPQVGGEPPDWITLMKAIGVFAFGLVALRVAAGLLALPQVLLTVFVITGLLAYLISRSPASQRLLSKLAVAAWLVIQRPPEDDLARIARQEAIRGELDRALRRVLPTLLMIGLGIYWLALTDEMAPSLVKGIRHLPAVEHTAMAIGVATAWALLALLALLPLWLVKRPRTSVPKLLVAAVFAILAVLAWTTAANVLPGNLANVGAMFWENPEPHPEQRDRSQRAAQNLRPRLATEVTRWQPFFDGPYRYFYEGASPGEMKRAVSAASARHVAEIRATRSVRGRSAAVIRARQWIASMRRGWRRYHSPSCSLAQHEVRVTILSRGVEVTCRVPRPGAEPASLPL